MKRFSSDIPMYHRLPEYFSISQKEPVKQFVHKQVKLAMEELSRRHWPLFWQMFDEHDIKSLKLDIF